MSHAQEMYPWSCTMAFQQRVHDATVDHASLVDRCLIDALRATPEKWRCRIQDIRPDALRAAFEDRVDSSTAWQQMKLQNSDRLYAQRVGEAMHADHILLSSLNGDMDKALAGSPAALRQFQELMENGTHITAPVSNAFEHFQYHVILVETGTGKVIWHFSYATDLTKPDASPLCDRLSEKFIRKFPLRNQ